MDKEKIKLEQKIVEAYDKHMEAIFKFCYFKTSDRELSKDLMQQTFLKTFEYLKKGNDLDNVRAFLYKIAGNLVIDWYRKKKEESLDILVEQGFDIIDSTINLEQDVEMELIIKTLDKLEPEEKNLIILRYREGLSPQEISVITGQKVNAISVKIHRTVDKLKKILHE